MSLHMENNTFEEWKTATIYQIVSSPENMPRNHMVAHLQFNSKRKLKATKQ